MFVLPSHLGKAVAQSLLAFGYPISGKGFAAFQAPALGRDIARAIVSFGPRRPPMPDLALPLPDVIALTLTLALWLGVGWVIEHPPARLPSVTLLMQDYRRAWMAEFVTRNPRVFDGTIIDSLRQSTAFFASASMIAVGGGLALIGNPALLSGVVADLPVPTDLAKIRLAGLVVVAFLVNALLKFVWASRLFGYCAVVMAAVPNDAGDAKASLRAGQAADLNITAAKSFNRGLRSIYFALGALAWILGPLALIAAAIFVTAVLLRRDFASVSRQVLLRGR